MSCARHSVWPNFSGRMSFAGGFAWLFFEVVKANIRRAGPDWQPAARDLSRSRAILELAFYHRDLRTCTNEEEAEKHRCLDRRRQYGAALIEACPGDWTKRPIVHRCKGCSCTTDEEAAEQVCSNLFTVTFNVLTVPSMNKWLSVWPLLCDLVLMGSFHRVSSTRRRASTDMARSVGGGHGGRQWERG